MKHTNSAMCFKAINVRRFEKDGNENYNFINGMIQNKIKESNQIYKTIIKHKRIIPSVLLHITKAI